MPTIASGSYTFEEIPTVNGLNVLLSGGGTGTVSTGTFASRPAPSTAGNLYVDTTNSFIWVDTGSSWTQLSTGRVLQVVSGSIAASSGTTTVPYDNSAPTSTEGNLIWSQAFTPISSTSRLIITFTITSASSIANGINIMSVFAGTTNIGAVMGRTQAANTPINMSLHIVYSPGSTSAITFTARHGGSAAATHFCNQTSTATLGGAASTEYTITEVL